VSDDPWSAEFAPPPPLRTDRVRLEVLGPDVVDLDYAAIMSSRARLRDELQWGKDRRWPPDDFTLDQNRVDLERHFAEFERREAYAYTVLDPAGETCIGCIYIEPHDDGARLAFWVVDEETDTGLEAHLLSAVFEWFAAEWSFGAAVVSLRPVNGRGIDVVESLGLRRLAEPARDGHVSYAWNRS
jgi:RimJ/RimL family protein N-acetyltransferase